MHGLVNVMEMSLSPRPALRTLMGAVARSLLTYITVKFKGTRVVGATLMHPNEAI